MASRAKNQQKSRAARYRLWLRRSKQAPIVVALAFITAATLLFVMSLLVSRLLSGVPSVVGTPPAQTGSGGGAFVPTATPTSVLEPTPTPDERLEDLLTRVASMVQTPVSGAATATPTPTVTPTPTLAPGQTPVPATLTPTPTATSSPTPTLASGQPTPTPTATFPPGVTPSPTPTPTPTRTPSPTPIPTRTAVSILTINGDGAQNTQAFEIVSKTWIVEWSTGASQSTYNLRIILADPRRSEAQREVAELVDEQVGATGALKGAVVVPTQFGPGTYFLKIFGPPAWEGGWRIVVRENPS